MKIKLFAAVLAATICMASVTPQAEAGSRAAENFLSGKESGSVGNGRQRQRHGYNCSASRRR